MRPQLPVNARASLRVFTIPVPVDNIGLRVSRRVTSTVSGASR